MRRPVAWPLPWDMPPPWPCRRASGDENAFRGVWLVGRAFLPGRPGRNARPTGLSGTEPPAGTAGAVLEDDAEFAEALADLVGLVEQRLLHRVVLAGDLLRLGAQAVPQVDEELHQPVDQ